MQTFGFLAKYIQHFVCLGQSLKLTIQNKTDTTWREVLVHLPVKHIGLVMNDYLHVYCLLPDLCMMFVYRAGQLQFIITSTHEVKTNCQFNISYPPLTR